MRSNFCWITFTGYRQLEMEVWILQGPPTWGKKIPAACPSPCILCHSVFGRICCVWIMSLTRGLIQVGWAWPVTGKTNCLSQSAQRAGRALPTQRTLHFVHKLWISQNAPFVYWFIIVWFPSRRKPSNLPRRCGLSQYSFLLPPEILSSYNFFHLCSS